MPAGETATAETVTVDSPTECHVVCYVRSSVPGPVAGTVEAVTERLSRLDERGHLGGCRIEHWPPERHAFARRSDRTDRSELLGEFERWAERRGCSLEPGFRRKKRPSSPLDVGSNSASDELVRVPVVALALYDGPPSETAELRDVIPRTEHRNTGDQRTLTVDEWLAAVETGRREPTAGAAGGTRARSLEGRQ
ncbi:HTH domain-containing protein [Natrarchaeobius sp. A-rgal3]|uniref:HTH domain-containing protein n=1 Tax=Natrarchaeobius versutus TaxID=1679078 RepID=UPI003510910C